MPHLTPEDILTSGVTLEDFCRFAGPNKVVWMTPGVHVSFIGDGLYNEAMHAFLITCDKRDDDPFFSVDVTPGTAAAAVRATGDFLVRLFAASEKAHFSMIRRSFNEDLWMPLPVSGAALSCLFQENRDNLCFVSLEQFILNQEHMRVMGAASRPTLKLELTACGLAEDDDCLNECLNAFVRVSQ